MVMTRKRKRETEPQTKRKALPLLSQALEAEGWAQYHADHEKKDNRLFALYKAWRTSGEMLYDRGYDVDENSFNIPFREFLCRFCRKPSADLLGPFNIYSSLKSDPNFKVVVFFFGNNPACHEKRREIASLCRKGELRRVIHIIVGQLQWKDFTKLLAVYYLASGPVIWEPFYLKDLFWNQARGLGVRRYQLVTAEEEKELLQGREVTAGLKWSNIIARYFGVKRGQFLKVVLPEDVMIKAVEFVEQYYGEDEADQLDKDKGKGKGKGEKDASKHEAEVSGQKLMDIEEGKKLVLENISSVQYYKIEG